MTANRYTLQTVGRGAKLLRHDYLTSDAITTLSDPAQARVVARSLNWLHDHGLGAFQGAVLDADRAGHTPALLRRRALNAFDIASRTTGVVGADGRPVRADLWWCEQEGTCLGAALLGEHPQSIAAVRGELADLFTHLDEVLVVAKFGSFHPGRRVRLVLNGWLAAQDDDTLRVLLRDGVLDDAPDNGTLYALHEQFVDQLADLEGLEREPGEVQVYFDTDQLNAWARHHRNDLLTAA